jgi:hypothetical protein
MAQWPATAEITWLRTAHSFAPRCASPERPGQNFDSEAQLAVMTPAGPGLSVEVCDKATPDSSS